MFVLFANSKMLFATNYSTLFSIYHIHGMMYHILSEPFVYISCYVCDGNVGVLNRSGDFGTGVPDSPGALSSHSLGTAHTVTHLWSSG